MVTQYLEHAFAPSKCDTCMPRLEIVLEHAAGPLRTTLPEYKLLKKIFSNAAKSFKLGTDILQSESLKVIHVKDC